MKRGFGPVAIAIVLIAGYLLATEAGAMLKNQEPDSLAYKIERFGEDFAVSAKLFPQDLKQKKLDEVRYWSAKDQEAARKVARDAIALGANVTEAGKSLGLLNTSMSEAQISAYISSEEPITDVNEWLRRILNTTLPESVNSTRFMLLPGNEVNYSGKLAVRLERIDNGSTPRALFYTYGNDYGVGYLKAGSSLELQGLSVKVESIQGGAAFFAVGEKKEPLVALISRRYADRLGPEISRWISDLESEGWGVTPVYLDSNRSIRELIGESRALLREKGLLDKANYAIVIGDVPWATDAWNIEEARTLMNESEGAFRDFGYTPVESWKIVTHIPYLYGNECVFSEILDKTAFCAVAKRYGVATGLIWPNTGDFGEDVGKMRDYFRRDHDQRKQGGFPKRVLYYYTTPWDYNHCNGNDLECIRERCDVHTAEMAKRAADFAANGIAMDVIGCKDKEFADRDELNSKMGKEFLERISGNAYDLVMINSHGSPSGIEGVGNEQVPGGQLVKNYAYFSCSVGRFEAKNYLAGSLIFNGNGLVAYASTTPIYVVSQEYPEGSDEVFSEISYALFLDSEPYVGDFTTLARNRIYLRADIRSPVEYLPLYGDVLKRAGMQPRGELTLSSLGSCSVANNSIACRASGMIPNLDSRYPVDSIVANLKGFFSGGASIEFSSGRSGAFSTLSADYSGEGLKDLLMETALMFAKAAISGNLISTTHPLIWANASETARLSSYTQIGRFLEKGEYEGKVLVGNGNSLYVFAEGNGTLRCEGKLRDDVVRIGSLYEDTRGKFVMDLWLTNGESIHPEVRDLITPKAACEPPAPQPTLRCDALDVNGDGKLDYNDLVYQIRPEDSSQAVADAKAKQILAVLVGAEECPKA